MTRINTPLISLISPYQNHPAHPKTSNYLHSSREDRPPLPFEPGGGYRISDPNNVLPDHPNPRFFYAEGPSIPISIPVPTMIPKELADEIMKVIREHQEKIHAQAEARRKIADSASTFEQVEKDWISLAEHGEEITFEDYLCFKQGLDLALELDPNNYRAYEARAEVHYELGDYEKAVEDFNSFKSLSPQPTNLQLTKEFCQGALKGLKSVAASWKDLLINLKDHPVHTTASLMEGLEELFTFALAGEICEVIDGIIPGARELVTNFKNLSSEERGLIFTENVAGLVTGVLALKGTSKAALIGVSKGKDLLKAAHKVRRANTLIGIEAASKSSLGTATEVIQNSQKIATAASEVQLGTRQLFKLKEQGKLSGSLQEAYENIFPSQAAIESFEKFERAQAFLKPYRNKVMPEIEIKKLIKKAGIDTFERPAGIPKDFLTKLSKGGGGIIYINPSNSENIVRVMPGKIHSGYPFQQKPYVVHRLGKKALDKFGNIVDFKSPSAHIPINEFIYRD